MGASDDKTDANLVLALDALLQERSVSKAAERIGIGQPAMSHALKRLREKFADPLLVRGDGRRMQLTPRALELSELARRGADAIDAVFAAPEVFDAGTSTRRFRVAATDAMDVMLLPPLLERLAREAPRVDLELPTAGPDLEVALEDGRLDLVLGRWDEPPLGLRRRRLYRERHACVVRTEHPGVGEVLDLPTYTALSHVLVAPRGTRRGVVDAALAQQGQQRRVAVVLPSFVAAAIVVSRSDLVLTVPDRIAQRLRDQLGLRVLPPPVELAPYDVQQVWHERDHNDAGHRWLRNLVVDALEAGDA